MCRRLSFGGGVMPTPAPHRTRMPTKPRQSRHCRCAPARLGSPYRSGRVDDGAITLRSAQSIAARRSIRT